MRLSSIFLLSFFTLITLCAAAQATTDRETAFVHPSASKTGVSEPEEKTTDQKRVATSDSLGIRAEEASSSNSPDTGSSKIYLNIDNIFRNPSEKQEQADTTIKDKVVPSPATLAKDSTAMLPQKEEKLETQQHFSNYINELCHEARNDLAIQRALEETRKLSLSEGDTAAYFGSPFFIELIYTGIPLRINWRLPNKFTEMLHGAPAATISSFGRKSSLRAASLYDLRRDARNEISRSRIDLYASIFTKLPSPSNNKSRMISTKPLQEVKFVEDISSKFEKRLEVARPVMGPWQKKANALVQFSQNYVSDNWHQGGSGNMAVLGILTGVLNYKNKEKTIQWENNGEWRAGFMNVDDSTALRTFNTSDDILKIISKLGIKASGNWFYGATFHFSTQFFDNYKSLNSKVFKTRFLTPVRMDWGLGMDYKHKDVLSVMLAPITYKFIYANDTSHVNPNSFGIETGRNALHQIGSSFFVQYNYSPFRELQINSKLKFYTNYEKVEIDWEIVGSFMVNRFLTTRISLNPRYDNTVILKGGEKARIQFKELMSFGFSFRLR